VEARNLRIETQISHETVANMKIHKLLEGDHPFPGAAEVEEEMEPGEQKIGNAIPRPNAVTRKMHKEMKSGSKSKRRANKDSTRRAKSS